MMRNQSSGGRREIGGGGCGRMDIVRFDVWGVGEGGGLVDGCGSWARTMREFRGPCAVVPES